MRLLAALLLVSCGSADVDFGEPARPDDGGAGGQGGEAVSAAGASSGGRAQAGSGGQVGTGGHACAKLRPGEPCLPPCTTDADCSAGWLCVEANANDGMGALVPVCRPPCVTQLDCDESAGERCSGFSGKACVGNCAEATRYACGILDVVCAVFGACYVK